METLGEWLIRHPAAVPLFIAALGAAFAFQSYRIGVTHARLQAFTAATASQALGG